MELTFKNKIIERGIKRLVDAVAAGIGLILLLPFFLIVALLIKIYSNGPVLYRHTRIVKGGKPFHLLKFRSMQQGKDDGAYVQYLKELIESERLANEINSMGGNGHHPTVKPKEDTKPQPYRKMEVWSGGQRRRYRRVGLSWGRVHPGVRRSRVRGHAASGRESSPMVWLRRGAKIEKLGDEAWRECPGIGKILTTKRG